MKQKQVGKQAFTLPRVSLNGDDWQLGEGKKPEQWLKARAPGNVQQDLWLNNIKPDPYVGTGANAYKDTEHKSWTLRRIFNISRKNPKLDWFLVFEGVDYKADFFLNGTKVGFNYVRHGGGHSDNNWTRSERMYKLRKDKSYLAFSNNSTGQYNDMHSLGWKPASIVDQTNLYEVELTGSGTVDVTLRRLQNFVVTSNKAFHYWIGSKSGGGTARSLQTVTVCSRLPA